MINIGVLTISDSCSRGLAIDRSGPLAIDLLQAAGGFELTHQACVADDQQTIHNQLLEWLDDDHPVNLIITTGGTGVGPRDVTYHVLCDLIDTRDRLPGLEVALLTESLKFTPMASLSRFFAGLWHNRTLVIALPGSTKAVDQCVPILIQPVKHALDLVLGLRTSSSSLNHHQHPTTTVVPVTQRRRIACSPMTGLREALAIVERLGCACRRIKEVELINSNQANGRVLARKLAGICNVPPYDASIMDGYAVKLTEGGTLSHGNYRVIGSLCPGDSTSNNSVVLESPDECYRVNTGGRLPRGCDLVVPVERTRLVSTTTTSKSGDSQEEEKEIEFDTGLEVRPGQFIRPTGSDLPAGHLFEAGLKLGPTELGLLSAAGLLTTKLPCYRLPRIALLSTGNELTSETITTTSRTTIYDSNRPMLKALLTSYGFDRGGVIDFDIVNDSVDQLHRTLANALDLCDVLITSGGVSMGECDLLPNVLSQSPFNATCHFDRLAVKPGKPTKLVSCRWSVHKHQATLEKDNRVILCLPGNPVSAYVTFILLGLPLLRAMSGWSSSDLHLPRIGVRLADESISLDRERVEFRRARLVGSSVTSEPMATCEGLGSQTNSSRLASCVGGANLLLQLPQADADRSRLKQGDLVEAILLVGSFI